MHFNLAASELRNAPVGREFDLDRLVFAGLDADQGFFDRREHRARTDRRGAALDALGGQALIASLRPGLDLDDVAAGGFALDRVPGAALQAQLFYLLNRHRQQISLRQGNLFAQATVSDYMFDRDKIFAYLNLDDNELFIYQRLYDLLVKDVSPPDLVVYLQTPTDVLLRRQREQRKEIEDDMPEPAAGYLRELNEAYQHFFFHYTATPLLVVEMSQFDLAGSDAALEDLIKQIRGMGRGTQYYVPRA